MAGGKAADRIDQTLDCIGLYCPMPVLQTREKMNEMGIGEVLEVLADDPAAEPDLQAWAKRAGQEMVSIDKTEEGLRFLIRKAE